MKQILGLSPTHMTGNLPPVITKGALHISSLEQLAQRGSGFGEKADALESGREDRMKQMV